MRNRSQGKLDRELQVTPRLFMPGSENSCAVTAHSSAQPRAHGDSCLFVPGYLSVQSLELCSGLIQSKDSLWLGV